MKLQIKPIILGRVSYGKKSTKIKDREYKPISDPQCAAGNKEEWRLWSKRHKLKIKFKE